MLLFQKCLFVPDIYFDIVVYIINAKTFLKITLVMFYIYFASAFEAKLKSFNLT